MDEIMRANSGVFCFVSAGLMGIAGAALAAGQASTPGPLPDPTRPPPEALLAPGEVIVAPVTALPTLQSVLISERPGGRRVAVIDGQTVRLGGTFDGAVLVRVSASEVALRRGKTVEVLTLSDKPPPDKPPVDKPPPDKPPVDKAPPVKPPLSLPADAAQLPLTLPATLIKMLTQ